MSTQDAPAKNKRVGGHTSGNTGMSQAMRTNLSYAFLMAILLALTLASLGLTRGVENEVSLDAQRHTITAGGEAEVELWVNARAQDGQAHCNPSDGTLAMVSFVLPQGVSATPRSLTFDDCQEQQQVTFRAAHPGDFQILLKVQDKGKGSYKPESSGLTLVVEPATDLTPPVIRHNITGFLGQAGWYTSKVFVEWQVADPESPVTLEEGCMGAFITYDSAGVTTVCQASSAGGSTQLAVVTVKVDATPPEVTLLGGPQDGASYPRGHVPPAPDCAASDAKSGLAEACRVTGYADTPGEHTVTAAAVDIAGNRAEVSATYQVLP